MSKGKRERNHEMMSKSQAVAYGKRNGIRYYVKNSLGGLFGGTKTYEQAVEMKSRWEVEVANDPFAPSDLKVFIVEA